MKKKLLWTAKNAQPKIRLCVFALIVAIIKNRKSIYIAQSIRYMGSGFLDRGRGTLSSFTLLTKSRSHFTVINEIPKE